MLMGWVRELAWLSMVLLACQDAEEWTELRNGDRVVPRENLKPRRHRWSSASPLPSHLLCLY